MLASTVKCVYGGNKHLQALEVRNSTTMEKACPEQVREGSIFIVVSRTYPKQEAIRILLFFHGDTIYATEKTLEENKLRKRYPSLMYDNTALSRQQLSHGLRAVGNLYTKGDKDLTSR